MIKNEVLLAVPSVDILTSAAATTLVAKPDNPKLDAVRQDFAGAFSGRALLIFPETNSLQLVREVVGRELALEDIVDLEDEALAETGNIILNSWVATIANLLKSALKMSLPIVIRGDSQVAPCLRGLGYSPGIGNVLVVFCDRNIRRTPRFVDVADDLGDSF